MQTLTKKGAAKIMAIELYWDNDEQNVMLCVFDKNWTWDEMFDTLNKVKKVTDQRDYEIGAIIDLRKGISIPGGSIFSADTREKARRMLAMSEDGKGPMVIVGGGTFIKTISGAFTMIGGSDVMNDVFFTNTMEEAQSIMAKRMGVGRRVLA